MGVFGNAGATRDRKGDSYERKKVAAARVSRDKSKAGRDIGPIPEIENPQRREAAKNDLRCFLLTYFPAAFDRPFSPDHETFIAETQRAIVEGYKKVRAMPRGSGKTTIFERAVLWAVLYGHCSMAALIAATDDRAVANLSSIAAELEMNDTLAADFPEACYPVRKLERIGNRAKGQTCNGRPTRISMVKDRIVLPTIEGSASAGAVIFATGLTGGGIRGAKQSMPDGSIARPSVALVDDPQTRKTASSPTENRTRELIVTGDVTGMAGPGKSLSVLMAVTVIYRGDLADRMLNRTLNPEWRGDRCRLLDAMPANMELWDKYHDIRANDLRANGDGAKGTRFYLANLEAMRASAQASWEHRKLPVDIDAIQHAMNLYFESREIFAAEYQNEPLDESPDGDELLTGPEIMQRVSSVPRRIVPIEADWITAHIDVHDRLLYFGVAAWSRSFKGYVIDYGTWPRQPVPYFSMRECRRTLADEYPGTSKDGAIAKGLADLTDQLCSREWSRETGDAAAFIDRLLIDEGYKARIVHDLCRRSEHRRILRPSKGWSVRAGNVAMEDWKERAGERLGENWRTGPVNNAGIFRIIFDANFWKTFTHRRLGAVDGDPSQLSLFGSDPKAHELFADHLVAEYREQLNGRGRWVDEWRTRPGRPDNHHFDNLVGCAVGASHLGAKLPDATVSPRKSNSTKQRRRRRGIRYAGK